MREHDLILHNGHVLTLDAASRTTEAIGVAAGAVSALGTSSEVLAGRGHATRVIDLEGRAVCPGFYDSHAHMDREGLKARGGFSLAGRHSVKDIVEGVRPRGPEDPTGRVGGVHAPRHPEARLRQPPRPARGRALPDPPRSRRRLAGQPGVHPRALGLVGTPAVRQHRQHPGPGARGHRTGHPGALQRRDPARRQRRAHRRLPRSLLRAGHRVHAASLRPPHHLRGSGGGMPARRGGVRGGRHHQHLRRARPHPGHPRRLPADTRGRRPQGTFAPSAQRARRVGRRPAPRPGGRGVGHAARPRGERGRHAPLRRDLRRRREREGRRDHRPGLPVRGVGGTLLPFARPRPLREDRHPRGAASGSG